jgi:hypothetical protein
MIPSKVKLRNFRSRIEAILTQELQLRADVKRMYDQFVLDVGDDNLALRHVRQAYFQIQKRRMAAIQDEYLEFHAFFGANLMSGTEGEAEEEDDGII